MRRLAVLLALVPAAAFALPANPPGTVAYHCDDGARLLVDYLHDKGVSGSARIVLTRGVHRWKMARQAGTAGDRYLDAKGTMEWVVSSNDATFTDLKTGKAAACSEQPPTIKK